MESRLSVLCGQMLVVGIEGLELTATEARQLSDGERGGVVLFRRNIADSLHQTAELNAAVKRASPSYLPPLVAIDQEGGRVMRLGAPAMQLPPMRRLGDTGDEELIARVAEAQARELAALGFTMSFAPVADIHTHDENPIIGDRAFATSADAVVRFAGAFADGLSRGGILSCAKHFPGHGDTTVDSHLALPRVDRPRHELDRIELAAFRALATRASVDAMMTAHVVYAALDEGIPATLSRAICTQLLRADLGFSGVLISDDLEMSALSMPIGEAAVLAVTAGCDMLLVCSRPDLMGVAHEALIREAEASVAFRARCKEAHHLSLTMRKRAPKAPCTSEDDLTRVFEASRTTMNELASRLSAQSAHKEAGTS